MMRAMQAHCATHPTANATHACTQCDALHCPPCLKSLTTEHNARPILMCPRCGGLARPLPEPERGEVEDMKLALRRPFDEEGLLLIAALSVPYWLTSIPATFISLFFNVIYFGTLSAIYFQVIEHVGRDAPGLPFSAGITSRWEVFQAYVRGLVCVLGGFWPALASAVFLPGNVWLTLALVILGVMLMPAVILSIALTRHTINGLWPGAWWAVVSHDPGAYAKLFALYIASSGAGLAGILLVALTIGRIPFFGGVFVGIALTTVALVQATLVGTWLRRAAVWPEEGS